MNNTYILNTLPHLNDSNLIICGNSGKVLQFNHSQKQEWIIGNSIHKKDQQPSQAPQLEYKSFVNSTDELFNANTWKTIPGKEIIVLKTGQTVIDLSTNKTYILTDPEYYKYLADKKYFVEVISKDAYEQLSEKQEYIEIEPGYFCLKDYTILPEDMLDKTKIYSLLIENKGWMPIGGNFDSISSEWKLLTEIN